MYQRLSLRVAGSSACALLLALSVLPAWIASAQETKTITVIITEFQFNPNAITLTVGQPVQLNIQNQGKADHSLLSNIVVTQVHYEKADNTRAEIQSYEGNNVINADAGSGHTSVVTFTPAKTGTFEFNSEDEESLGLVGQFVVVDPGSQVAVPAAPAPPTAAAAGNATAARDGQTLASQSAATQAMFTAVWGDRAAQEWIQEHNAALAR